MNDSARRQASEYVRGQFRRKIDSARVGRNAGLQPPTVDEGSYAEKPLLKSAVLLDDDKELILQIPALAFTRQDDLYVMHATQDVEADFSTFADFIIDAAEQAKFPYQVVVDKEKFLETWGEGNHFFKYRVVLGGNGETSSSSSLQLVFDRIPPHGNVEPDAFPSVSAVTDASLAAGGDEVELALPVYTGQASGDEVFWYWLKDVPADFEDVPYVGQAPATAGAKLAVSGDYIRSVGDGGLYAVYVIRDKAGNLSRVSKSLSIGVALGDVPVTLPEPSVPLATEADSFLIDQADAQLGVEVWIEVLEQFKSTDHLAVTWGAAPLEPEPVGSAPGSHVRVSIPNKILSQEYGEGTKGDKPTKVSYRLLRGTVDLGGEDVDIVVNFESIGPTQPDPDWPDPVDDALPIADVQGRGSSSTKNELNRDDNALDADVSVALFSTVEDGDLIEFYWGDEKVDEYTVKTGDNASDVVNAVVPWAVIESHGNGPSLLLHYWISRTGIPNKTRSKNRGVKVDAIIFKPEAPGFDGLNGNQQITCGSLVEKPPHNDDPAVRVKVPKLPAALSADDTLTLSWTAVYGKTGDGEEPVKEADYSEPVTLTNEMLEGFIWRVPYETYVSSTSKPGAPYYGEARGRVTYSYDLPGETITSKVGEVKLAVFTPEGACDVRGVLESGDVRLPIIGKQKNPTSN